MIITNLFSVFDPTIRLFSFSWLIGVIVLLYAPFSYWLARSFLLIYSSFLTFIMGEVNYVIKPVKGVYIFIGSIFSVICLFNFLALFPFIFSLTSHLLVTLPFSYIFWIAIIFFSWFSSLKHFFSHLIPVGTPFMLIRFIVVVEILRNFIRPLALTFRLTANIMAGHLLISLIGGALLSLPFSGMLFSSVFQSLLVFIELGVSLIQAYVFSTLLMLYISESIS